MCPDLPVACYPHFKLFLYLLRDIILTNMANNFYSSQILPGTPPPKEKQGHLAVIFIIIGIVIVLVVAFWLVAATQTVAPTSNGPTAAEIKMRQEREIAAQLSNTVPPPAEAMAAIQQQLKNSKQTLSAEQQVQISQQLQ